MPNRFTRPDNAMVVGALDDEILPAHLRGNDLRSYAGIGGLQLAVLQVGPIAPDRRIEFFRALGIDRIVDPVDPFHVGAKARLSGEVDRQMGPEAAGNGDG